MALRGFFERIRAAAEQYISGLLREGKSAQEVVQTLQDAGLGYGEEKMLNDVEESQAADVRFETIGAMGIYETIPEDFFVDKRWRTQWQYVYNFEYTYYDKTLRTTVTDHFAIARMDRVSLNDLQAEIDAVLGRIGESLGIRAEDVRLISGVHVVPRVERG